MSWLFSECMLQSHCSRPAATPSQFRRKIRQRCMRPDSQFTDGPGKLVGSRPVSRVLSRTIIHLRPTSPWAFSNQPENQRGPRRCSPIWSCSGWGLPCHSCYHQRGALLPHHFTLTRLHGRYIFCGTFRRLAPPRCYLAPCPMEPGLSSPADHTGKPAR